MPCPPLRRAALPIAATALLAACGPGVECVPAAEKQRRIADARDLLAQAQTNEMTVMGFSSLSTRNGRQRIAEAKQQREDAARALQAVERQFAQPQPGCS